MKKMSGKKSFLFFITFLILVVAVSLFFRPSVSNQKSLVSGSPHPIVECACPVNVGESIVGQNNCNPELNTTVCSTKSCIVEYSGEDGTTFAQSKSCQTLQVCSCPSNDIPYGKHLDNSGQTSWFGRDCTALGPCTLSHSQVCTNVKDGCTYTCDYFDQDSRRVRTYWHVNFTLKANCGPS